MQRAPRGGREPMQAAPSFMTLRENTRQPAGDGSSMSSADSMYAPGGSNDCAPAATHDISRVSYHVKHLETFAQTLEESASKAFPNRGGRSFQRYSKVSALLMHWKCDDLFVLPELEDLERCLHDGYEFDTEIFPIPSDNSHLELTLKIADMIKRDEAEGTLFIIYYGGHAKIDDSRQSTWCATRASDSPWLQWSAIQTLLERSVSDVLVLLDCCAGAASATFSHGKSITETISASSWDAVAPDPGRYSFTSALIEVLSEWRLRTFSAAMLHSELLARLKHPRPVLINGKRFEARSTPVHFMMTSDHRAPSIELGRIVPASQRPPSPPELMPFGRHPPPQAPDGVVPYQGRSIAVRHRDAEAPLPPLPSGEPVPPAEEPNENKPHVMISLALEDNQELDLNAWESWLSSFPALAKYVKVQGVFKSHSTLLLLSLPVMVWDMLPDNPACSFVAFIRSNNLLGEKVHPEDKIGTAITTGEEETVRRIVPDLADDTATGSGESVQRRPRAAERESIFSKLSGATFTPGDEALLSQDVTDDHRQITQRQQPVQAGQQQHSPHHPTGRPAAAPVPGATSLPAGGQSIRSHLYKPLRAMASTTSFGLHRQTTAPAVLNDAALSQAPRPDDTSRSLSSSIFMNQSKASKKATFTPGSDVPEPPALAKHVIKRLEEYFRLETEPSLAVTEFLSSNLGVETAHVHCWFHHRRLRKQAENNMQSLRLEDQPPESKRRDGSGGVRMILAGHLSSLMTMFPPPSRAGGGGGGSMLLIDLRSAGEFEKSHVYGAVNLTAPARFVASPVTTLEAIEDTLVTDSEGQGQTGRRTFNRWFQARCIVFYDRAAEFDWECPVAGALCDKFRRKGWLGQCFVLKGNYHEFSASFDKYISGARMSKEAERYLAGLTQQRIPTKEDLDARHDRYEHWIQNFEHEDRHTATAELPPYQRVERERAVELHQRELEACFEVRFPVLWKRVLAQARRPMAASGPGSGFDSAAAPSPPPPRWTATPPSKQHTSYGSSGGAGTCTTADHDPNSYPPEKKSKDADSDFNFDLVKAPMVGHLASGLDKMRQASGGGGGGGGGGGEDKLSSSFVIPDFDFASKTARGDDHDYLGYAPEKLGQQQQHQQQHPPSQPQPQSPQRRSSDEYDEIDPKSEGLRNDPAFQRAGWGGTGSTAGGGYADYGGDYGPKGAGGGDGLKAHGGNSPGGGDGGTTLSPPSTAMDDEGHKKGTKRGFMQRLRNAGR